MIIEGHIWIGDPLREGDIEIKVGEPPDQGGCPDRGPSGGVYPIEMEDPLVKEDNQEEPPDGGPGGLPSLGGLHHQGVPLMVEDLPVMEDLWTSPPDGGGPPSDRGPPGPLMVEDLPVMEDPFTGRSSTIRGSPLMVEDLPVMDDPLGPVPLMVEDLPVMEDPLDP